MAGKLRPLRIAGELLLSALVLVAAGRFTFVAALPLLRGASAEANQEPEAPPDTGVEALSALERDLRGLLENDRQPQRPHEEREPPPAEPDNGDRIEVMLSVTVGGNRSQVFVDGALVGQTAFVGQVGCRRGSELQIRIVPRRGEPLLRTRPCTGEMILVSD